MLVEISFSSVGREVAYIARGPGIYVIHNWNFYCEKASYYIIYKHDKDEYMRPQKGLFQHSTLVPIQNEIFVYGKGKLPIQFVYVMLLYDILFHGNKYNVQMKWDSIWGGG